MSAADAGIAALRDAGLLPPDGGRTLRDALQRAHNGEDPGVIEAEIYANSDRIDVEPDTTGGQQP